jgi:eukaryotic-like serine/threonine-protein kinase
MPLSPGDKLGPYEILAPIGAGGMGEVYRARDSRLGRDVAIKVSAERFSERFDREARAIAALNHPNICSLFDIGPNFLVMEYVEGEAPKGPLPLEETLRIARQIASALEEAHEKGITHRDLKPGNIKIKTDGAVKVLDFGLAKIEASSAVSQSENSPTLSMAATQMGVILGTAGYMSPEQARGKPVDRRADIWAFGVVLYELLTGERLFEGEDITETLASVVKEQPDLSKVPVQVRPLLQRCLEKDPRRRLRDIGDAMPLLDVIPEAEPAPIVIPHARWLPWLIAGALAIALAALGAIHWLRPAPAEQVVKLSMLPPEGASFIDIGATGGAVLSPDGTMIAFVAQKSGQQPMLWVRPLNSLEARSLPGTEDGGGPFWSPDSRSLGFVAQGKIKRIDVAGGPALALADGNSNAGQNSHGSWNSDGKILFSLAANTNFFLVSAAGGERSEATKLDTKLGETSHLWPEFLPDGQHYLYHVRIANGAEFQVYVGVLGSNQRTLLLKNVSNAHYAPPLGEYPGYLLYVRDATLMAQPFDERRLAFTGDPVAVAEQVSRTNAGTGADFSVSSNGILAYRGGGAVAADELVWYDRAGKQASSVFKRPGAINRLRLSPSGKVAAFDVGTQGSGQAIETWLYDLDRGISQRFTFSGGLNPGWSPDGSQIAFSRLPEGIFRKASSGAGMEEALWKDQVTLVSSDWSGDGRYLLVSRLDPKAKADLWLLPVDGDHKPIPLLQTQSNEQQGTFSPGPMPRWVAYQSDESGHFEVYVMPMPGGLPGKWQISNGGGQTPRWRRDGRELYYIESDSRTIMAVDVNPGPGFSPGTPHALFKANRLRGVAAWDVSADGQKFLISLLGEEASTSPINVVLNWQAGLKK